MVFTSPERSLNPPPDIIRMILNAPLSKSPHSTIHQDVYAFPRRTAASLAAPFPILSSRKVAFSTSARKTTGNAADSSGGNHPFRILRIFTGLPMGRAEAQRDLTCALYCLLGGITRVICRETNA